MLLPVGCSGYDDWLLDSLNVERLLKQAAGSGSLDLIQCCTSTSLSPVPAPAARPSVTPTRGASAAEPAVQPFAALLAGGGAASVSEAGLGAEPDDGLPVLQLKSLQVGECRLTAYPRACAGCAALGNLRCGAPPSPPAAPGSSASCSDSCVVRSPLCLQAWRTTS